MYRRAVLTAASTVLPLIAGCLGGEAGGTSPTGGATETVHGTRSPTETLSPTPTPEQAPAQEAFPGYDWEKLDGVTPVATSNVVMEGFEFHPLVAAVQPDSVVTVRNDDSAAHTITVPKLSLDQEVAGGESVSFKVGSVGTIDYLCKFHPPGMVGRVKVTQDTPSPTTTTPKPSPSSPTATPTEGGLY